MNVPWIVSRHPLSEVSQLKYGYVWYDKRLPNDEACSGSGINPDVNFPFPQMLDLAHGLFNGDEKVPVE